MSLTASPALKKRIAAREAEAEVLELEAQLAMVEKAAQKSG
jgi:hypothetical protein